jgi:hyaluronate lyase
MVAKQIVLRMEERIGETHVFFRFYLKQDLGSKIIEVKLGDAVHPVTLSFKGVYSVFLSQINHHELVILTDQPEVLAQFEFVPYDPSFHQKMMDWSKQYLNYTDVNYEKLYHQQEESYDAHEVYLYKHLMGQPSAQLRDAFRRIEVIAQVAYSNQDDHLWSVVLERLTYLMTHHYHSETKYRDNWWDYEIGIPKTLLTTLSLMDFKKQAPFIMHALDTIFSFSHDPLWMYTRRTGFEPIRATGANVMDLLEINVRRLLLTQQKEALKESIAVLHPLLEIVEEGDGFYQDGSFIQHDNIAYTGAYGEVLLRQMANLLSLYKTYDLSIGEVIEPLTTLIRKAFLPILYKGHILDSVRGRSISREQFTDQNTGYRLSLAVSQLRDLAPIDLQPFYNAFLLEHLSDKVAKNSEIEQLTYPQVTAFQSMNRYYMRQPNSLIGISCSSSSIATFELMNGENLKGWYYGLGYRSYYYGNQSPYTYGYYPTINPYYLPGVTNTLKPLDRNDLGTTVDNQMTSGLIQDDHLLIGFHLNGPYDDVEGYITNLIHPEGLISIGSKIRSQSDDEVVTTIFNESISLEDINTTDNSYLKEGQFIEIKKNHNNHINQEDCTINMEHNQLEENDDLTIERQGYYVAGDYTVETETRTGTYRDINDTGSLTPITRTYVKGFINHGKRMYDGKFEYAFLPELTEEKKEDFMKHKPYTVLQQDSTHVIDFGDYLFVNHFEEKAFTIQGITVFKPCQLILTKGKNQGQSTGEMRIKLAIVNKKEPFFIQSSIELRSEAIIHRKRDQVNYYELSDLDQANEGIEIIILGEE